VSVLPTMPRMSYALKISGRIVVGMGKWNLRGCRYFHRTHYTRKFFVKTNDNLD